MHIDFPFTFDNGRTRTTVWRDHKRDLLLQFLLTHLGERVNRPDFGTPLSRMCFESNSDSVADVIQFVAKAGVQRFLGDTIEVLQLDARAEDANLMIDLQYRIHGEQELRREQRRIPLSGELLP